jgi:hypothetical protein
VRIIARSIVAGVRVALERARLHVQGSARIPLRDVGGGDESSEEDSSSSDEGEDMSDSEGSSDGEVTLYEDTSVSEDSYSSDGMTIPLLGARRMPTLWC